MANKKPRVETSVNGSDVEWFQGNDSWISCRTKDGQKFSIGGDMLFKILSNFSFSLLKHGENWRTIDITPK